VARLIVSVARHSSRERVQAETLVYRLAAARDGQFEVKGENERRDW